ncbi:ACT domain-containing protein [Sharpea azabuensis]|uniref:ACT domain-containing protein n=1 Tax=Sharpea azabuensis TaxID=322505 RepID=UPI0030B82447
MVMACMVFFIPFQGTMDFSLIGILSKLSGILADHKIGIFAVSTYNTNYILVKKLRKGIRGLGIERIFDRIISSLSIQN